MNIMSTTIRRISEQFCRSRRRRNSLPNPGPVAAQETLECRRLLSADGWSPGLDFESEHNDTRGSANQIALTSATNPSADTIHTGAIRTLDDVDYYKFELHSASSVQLDVYNLHPDRLFSGDIDLVLESSSGNRLSISNRSGGKSERIEAELDAGTYFAKVYPYDSTGFGVGYQLRLQSETNAVPPGRPTLTGPATGGDLTPTFKWTAASNATHYELRLINLSTNQRVVQQNRIAETEFTPQDELTKGSFQVWVRAWNNDIPGQWSSSRTFRLQPTTTPPGRPRVTGPVDAGNTKPVFNWTSASNATHYQLSVENASGQRVIQKTNLSPNSFTPTSNLTPGNYTAWVRAWNNKIPGQWSGKYQFTVLGNPDPNGANNGRESATSLGQVGGGSVDTRVKDLLHQKDRVDFFSVNIDNRYTNAIQFKWTISVTSGKLGDLSFSLWDKYGRQIPTTSFSINAVGNQITLQSKGRLPMGLRGHQLFLKMELKASATQPVVYGLRLEARR